MITNVTSVWGSQTRVMKKKLTANRWDEIMIYSNYFMTRRRPV
jgi:hypothetical protein